MSGWQVAEDRRDLAFKAGRYSEAYGKPAHTTAQIMANYAAAFKAEHEWKANDIIEIVTATKERMSGVVTGPVEDDQVMVLFEDGIHWSYGSGRCHVRRDQ